MSPILTLPVCLVVLTGCAQAAVRYGQAVTPPADGSQYADDVAKAAENGMLDVTLPISRVVVQPPGASSLNPPAPAAPAKGNSAGGTGSPASASAGSGVSTTLTGTDGKPYVLSVVQAEGPTTFRVHALNNFFSSNQLGITRLANTDIPIAVSNTFTDETAAHIKTVASLATTVAGVAFPLAGVPLRLLHGATRHAEATAPKCTATAIVDVRHASNQPDTDAHPCYQITIALDGTHQKDTVPVVWFTQRIAQNPQEIAGVWPVPACADAEVTIVDPANNTVVNAADLKVIDPDYVQLLPIPQKGKIAMHPICGADFSDSPGDKWQAYFDDISALEGAFQKPSGSTGGGSSKAGH